MDSLELPPPILRPTETPEWKGPLPLSKSWLNRALILRSFDPAVSFQGANTSEVPFEGDDTFQLRRSLGQIGSERPNFNVGDSGTGFRFLLARLSRLRGDFVVRGSERLLSRPHAELARALAKLGCTVEPLLPGAVSVKARGWPQQDLVGDRAIEIDSSESSQFASALLLASVDFPHRFELRLTGAAVSAGYFAMTQKLVNEYRSGKRQLEAELDASTLFTLIAVQLASALRQRSTQVFARLPAETARLLETTLQPDAGFLPLLAAMGVQVEKTAHGEIALSVPATGRGEVELRAIDADLRGSPDLFPVLAALCALARGRSRLHGAPHLRLKESDRIAGTARLLAAVGVQHETSDDGLSIEGRSFSQADCEARQQIGFGYEFDPDSDHRLAFAAGVLAAGGMPIALSERGVVRKSFPVFFEFLEGLTRPLAIVGHRGVGKSEFAKRWLAQPPAQHRLRAVDLDCEIEERSGSSVAEIFSSVGEAKFRVLEAQTLRQVAGAESFDDDDLLDQRGLTAVLGAGFDIEQIPPSWLVLWLRRQSDATGRIFLDRPRLNPELSALDEYRQRFAERDIRFRRRADRVLDLAEGEGDPAIKVWMADFLGESTVSALGGVVSLNGEGNLVSTVERLLRWGVQRIEVRDDIVTSDLAWSFLERLPPSRLIISFRAPARVEATLRWLKLSAAPADEITVDWPLEMGEPPAALMEILRPSAQRELANTKLVGAKPTPAQCEHTNLILSSHATGGVSSAIAALTTAGEKLKANLPPGVRLVLKAALPTDTWSELAEGHSWSKQTERVFLPLSADGRWAWYRAWLGAEGPLGLNFWREGEGTALDQPTFSMWWRARRFPAPTRFAAVLGHPVQHSRTPIEHDEFFCNRGLPVFAIDIGDSDEEFAIAWKLLGELGLAAAAVTAPHKPRAAQAAGETDPCNTLVKTSDGSWRGTSTDAAGFAALWKIAAGTSGPGDNVAIWGGGGVLPSLLAVAPKAVAFSASNGKLRPAQAGLQAKSSESLSTAVSSWQPEAVIVASGDQIGAWPANWRPAVIIDLSYTDASAGRAIAQMTGARYISGLAMFEAQARAQREFWERTMSGSR